MSEFEAIYLHWPSTKYIIHWWNWILIFWNTPNLLTTLEDVLPLVLSAALTPASIFSFYLPLSYHAVASIDLQLYDGFMPYCLLNFLMWYYLSTIVCLLIFEFALFSYQSSKLKHQNSCCFNIIWIRNRFCIRRSSILHLSY